MIPHRTEQLITHRTSPTSVWAAFLLLLALLAFLPTAAAHADAYLGSGTQIEPLESSTTSDGLSTDGSLGTESTSADGTFYCSVAYATIAASPSGYAVGNCPQNTEFRRIAKSGLVGTGTGQGYYDGGYILGGFSGCGWIRTDQTSAYNTTTQWNHCDPNSIGYTKDEFMYKFADGSYYYDGCAETDDCKGTPVNNKQTCYTVANVRPWLSGQGVPAAIRYIPANATHLGAPRFAFRYVAKYPTTDGTYWAMGRDRAYSSGQGNWVFVPLSCL